MRARTTILPAKRGSMDYNVLMEKLASIEDEQLQTSMRTWVADVMMPTLVKCKVLLNIDPGKTVDCDGIDVGGYFTDEPFPELALALATPSWAETMIHEVCHMQQWVEKSPLWKNEHPTELVDYWYDGKCELTKDQLDTYFNALIDVEVDAERRSIKMIKEYEIPIDTKKYAQKANAYLYCYHEYRRRRKWNVPGKAAYLIPEIVAEMPTNLSKRDYKNPKIVTAKLRKLYDACFEK